MRRSSTRSDRARRGDERARGNLAILESPVSAQGARSRDTALLDWLHGVQLAAGKAELSFCSLLPAQPPDWPAGPLTLRQVWAFYPYENSLVTVEATGRQMREALERSAGCIVRPSELGRNCDTLAGADYVLDPARPDGSRVASLTREGRDVSDDDVFTVAINSYRASGGGGYPMWKSARRMSETGSLRDLLAADARARSACGSSPTATGGRWESRDAWRRESSRQRRSRRQRPATVRGSGPAAAECGRLTRPRFSSIVVVVTASVTTDRPEEVIEGPLGHRAAELAPDDVRDAEVDALPDPDVEDVSDASEKRV